jgi:predicted  nucleic acid-binding Zn-ribbon protein
MDDFEKIQKAAHSIRELEKLNNELSIRIELRKRQISAYLKWVITAEDELSKLKTEYHKNEEQIAQLRTA